MMGENEITRRPSGGAGRGDALMHPVRLRIVDALQGGPLTPQAIGAKLGDIPLATLYRHLRQLLDAGWVEIVDQRQAHGAVEKTYAVVGSSAILSRQDVENIAPETILSYFRAFTARLLSEFGRYTRQRAPLRVLDDGIVFATTSVRLTDDEFTQLKNTLRTLIEDAAKKSESRDRHPRLISLIAIPEPRHETNETLP